MISYEAVKCLCSKGHHNSGKVEAYRMGKELSQLYICYRVSKIFKQQQQNIKIKKIEHQEKK